MLRCVFVVVLLASLSALGSTLLPFGSENEDESVAGHQRKYIKLDNPIILDNEKYQLIGINKRGYLSLGKATLHFSEHDAKIVVIKTESDSRLTKPVDVFFRVTNDTDMKYAIDSLIEKTYKTQFQSKQILITTWIQYGCPNELITERTKRFKRTTQCIVTGDKYRSYTVYMNEGDGDCNGGHKEINGVKRCKVAGGNCSKEDVTASYHPQKIQEAYQDTSVVVQLHRDPVPGGLDAMSEFDFFQLSTDRGNCLTLSTTAGSVQSCNDDNGQVEQMTVFRLHGSPGNQQIELFGSGQCLDREHCHSSTSNVRSSDCSHCGAIHWDLRKDGTLREDQGSNCIYVIESTNMAAIHHSADGCTNFQVKLLGNTVQLKSISHGDCVGGGVFTSCSSPAAGRFVIYNLPRNHQLKDQTIGLCFDREHCHSSTSNTRFYDCDHCGATHWSIENSMVGEDDMSNCVNRGPANSAVMEHCDSDGWENITCEISTGATPMSSSLPPTSSLSSNIVTGLPKPDSAFYMNTIARRRLIGARLYKDALDGSSQLEFVHALPNQNTFSVVVNQGVFQVQYWVTTIITKVPHNDTCTPGELFDTVISTPNAVKKIQLRYGVIDVTRRRFGEKDGLLSLFITEEDSSMLLPNQIVKQFGTSLKEQNWWRSSPSVHHATHNQSYFTFAGETLFYQALYWPKN